MGDGGWLRGEGGSRLDVCGIFGCSPCDFNYSRGAVDNSDRDCIRRKVYGYILNVPVVPVSCTTLFVCGVDICVRASVEYCGSCVGVSCPPLVSGLSDPLSKRPS